MATKKIRMRPEGDNDYADVLHPETSADMIVETADKKVMTAAERTKLANLSKSDVGLSNVTNDAQMPIAGGTFTGVAVAHTAWK